MYWLLEKKGDKFQTVAVRATIELLVEELLAKNKTPKGLIAAKEIEIKQSFTSKSTDVDFARPVSVDKDFPSLPKGVYFLVRETYDSGMCGPENLKRKITKYDSPEKPLEELIKHDRQRRAGTDCHLIKTIKLDVKYKVELK